MARDLDLQSVRYQQIPGTAMTDIILKSIVHVVSALAGGGLDELKNARRTHTTMYTGTAVQYSILKRIDICARTTKK
jgi:hypothetical protein